MGSITASKANILACLKKGASPCTFIDGIHGMFACSRANKLKKIEVECMIYSDLFLQLVLLYFNTSTDIC